MKNKKLKPLDLDKQTIAKLDEKQIDAILGGKKGRQDNADETANGWPCSVTCNGNDLQQELS